LLTGWSSTIIADPLVSKVSATMSRPKFRRRKEERPRQIIRAAMGAFAEKGFDATRVTDVARRAGVSKGLLYLYFRTKEELFKAVIKSVVMPRLDALSVNVERTDLTATEFLRGPFLEFACEVPRSPAQILIRLMIAEGPKHPDLTGWYWENVVSRGIALLRRIIDRGVAAGEFRPSALQDYPQILIAPVLFSVVWTSVFSPHHALDTDRYIESHLDLILDAISLPATRTKAGTS
jgi:AcrR family transcriptional regulator